ncbi:mitochondrial ribosomal protein L53-like protein [Leptotrombidium deliense]|uniref:Large ribosomal subunit protein mL53 n=1 Tax=Leptotrombidium deliense TaxID=299467 RepID=A0A443SAJ3_9ACAR|nr:mitochondrial ribosomal protein L53-like protein [Leptotrombidium deliense]
MASQLLKRRYQSALNSAIGVNVKKLNFKPVKTIDISFDPFSEGASVVRHISHVFSSLKYRKTNPECIIRTKVVCDRSEPMINVKLGAFP